MAGLEWSGSAGWTIASRTADDWTSTGLIRLRPQKHAVKVARIVGVGEEVEVDVGAGALELVPDVTKRREILDGEADAVEQRDLPLVHAPRRTAGEHLPELGHWIIAVELLDFPLHAGLGRILDENVGPQQDPLRELGLAGAVAADGVDVQAGADHVVGQDRRPALVGGAGRDDFGAENRLFA